MSGRGGNGYPGPLATILVIVIMFAIGFALARGGR